MPLKIKNAKYQTIKNLLSLYVAFLLIYSASNGLTSVQSILNPIGNIGIISQITIFCVQIPLSLVFPAIFIEMVGFKRTMLIVEIGFFCYIASNVYAKHYIIIPCEL